MCGHGGNGPAKSRKGQSLQVWGEYAISDLG